MGSPLIDGIFFVMRVVQFNARSACDASMFTSYKNIPSISGLPMISYAFYVVYFSSTVCASNVSQTRQNAWSVINLSLI